MPGTAYIWRLHVLQESEGEEAAESRVTLGQNLGRGNIAERQSRVEQRFGSYLVALECGSCPSLLTACKN